MILTSVQPVRVLIKKSLNDMKNNIFRIFAFVTLILTGFSGPFWLFIVGAVVYVFIFRGLEMIILGAAIDAYFGFQSGGWFGYTVCISIGVFFAQWVKPYLSVYNQ